MYSVGLKCEEITIKDKYNQIGWGFEGVRMERNQKEILGVMMKQLGLDRGGSFVVAALAFGEEGRGTNNLISG